MIIKTMTGFDSILTEDYLGYTFSYVLSSSIDIFFPLGKPILPHLHRYGPFEVDDHIFMDRCLASTATSTREHHKFQKNGVHKKCRYQ